MNLSALRHDQAIAELWERGILRYKLHAGQRVLREWYQSSSARITVLNIARRYGKSTFLVGLAIEHALATPNGRVIFAAPTREQARDIISPIFKHLLADCPAHLRPKYNEARNFFEFHNGCEIHIEGADDEHGSRLRGTKATLILCDEVGFWRYPVEVIKSVLLPQTMTCNGRIIAASTPPESTYHAFWDLVAEARANGSYQQRTIYENPLVTPVLIEEYKRESGGEESSAWRREYLCERVAEISRAVLPEFSFKLHVGEHTRPEFWDGYVSLDLGMVDLSHALYGYYDFDLATIVVTHEVVRQYATVSELAPELLAAEIEAFGEQEPKKRVSDAQPISLAEFARQHALQPDKVPRDMRFAAAENRQPEALINRTRSLLHAVRIKIHPRCVQLVAQAEGGLWNARRTDFERIPGLGHLDGVMALVYLVDAIDYALNPASRKRYDTQHYPVRPKEAVSTKRFGALTKLMPPGARR